LFQWLLSLSAYGTESGIVLVISDNNNSVVVYHLVNRRLFLFIDTVKRNTETSKGKIANHENSGTVGVGDMYVVGLGETNGREEIEITEIESEFLTNISPLPESWTNWMGLFPTGTVPNTVLVLSDITETVLSAELATNIVPVLES